MNKLLKTTFILLLTLFGANSSFSQSLVWEKLVGHPNRADRCYTSARLGKTRYLFGGFEHPLNQNTVVPLLIATNTNGDTVLTRRYPQYTNGIILAVVVNNDSTILAAGTYLVNNQGRGFLFKTDPNGVILWQKDVHSTHLGNRADLEIVPGGYLLIAEQGAIIFKLDEQGTVLWQKEAFINSSGGGISLMKDGSYLACGWTTERSSTTLQSFYRPNPFLAKLKPNGDTIRTKVFGSFANQDMLYEAKETADGGIIMVGRYVINANPTKMQGLVMKFDSAWNQQWWYTIMPPHGDYDKGCELFNVLQLADSSYIVSGNYINSHPSGYGDDNGYIANITKDGSAITWQQQYSANTYEVFTSMFYMNDGSAVFSGRRHLQNNIDFYLVKLKNLGLPYVPNYCQQKPLPGLSVQVITNDTIAFTSNSFPGTRYGSISTYLWRFGDGTTSAFPNPKHKYNMPLSALQNIPVTLIVTNNSGCTDSITTYPFLRVSAPDVLPGLQLQLYPNPASGKATFTISGNTNKEAVRIELTDVLGRKLNVPVKQSQQNENQQLEVNTATLPTGLYIYRLYSGSRLLSTGKLVKE